MQPPQTKFTLQWTTVNRTPSNPAFWVFYSEKLFQINFNQTVLTNKSFRSEWIEIKLNIQVKFLFDWRQSVAIFTLWLNFGYSFQISGTKFLSEFSKKIVLWFQIRVSLSAKKCFHYNPHLETYILKTFFLFFLFLKIISLLILLSYCHDFSSEMCKKSFFFFFCFAFFLTIYKVFLQSIKIENIL